MLDRLTDFLAARTDRMADVPILQPAGPFLDAAGEDLRRRIFITDAADGTQMCLRPEFTIPLCLAHNGTPERIAYGGRVFRQEREDGTEFDQVGLEDLGNAEKTKADAQCLRDAADTLNEAGIEGWQITLGDQALFDCLVRALGLPDPIAERLERLFGDRTALDTALDTLGKGARLEGDEQALAYARSGDRVALVKHVADLMAQSGLSPRAGRAPETIADRLISKVAQADFSLSEKQRSVLRAYLAIETPLVEASQTIADFGTDNGIDFAEPLAVFRERLSLFGAGDGHRFRASLGRNLDYYTGLLFEVHAPGTTLPMGGGGRYDRLCSLLGATEPLPAVGFSLSLDRLSAAREAQI